MAVVASMVAVAANLFWLSVGQRDPGKHPPVLFPSVPFPLNSHFLLSLSMSAACLRSSVWAFSILSIMSLLAFPALSILVTFFFGGSPSFSTVGGSLLFLLVDGGLLFSLVSIPVSVCASEQPSDRKSVV